MLSSGPKRYDAFLSYNSQDRPAVRQIEERLKREKLNPYLEASELLGGRQFLPELGRALDNSKTCVVFLGPSGLGPWQREELTVALDTRVRDKDFHVIPVLLPGADRTRRGDVPYLKFLQTASWIEFLKTVDDELAFRNLVAGIRGIQTTPVVGQDTGICPYRGLEAFTEQPKDVRFFFGRKNLTSWLVIALRRPIRAVQGVRFLSVLGPSGSGKSSVVRAGLVPELRAGAIEGSERWPVAILRPGDDPLKSLSEKIVPLLRKEVRPDPSLSESGEQKELLANLRADGVEALTELDRYVGLKFSDQPDDRRLVIVVDQFEEVFTYRPQDDEARLRFEQARAAFFTNLLHAAAAPEGRVAVVVAMRSDFLSACATFPQLAAVLSAHQELVGPMTEAELREAIEEPAFRVGCEVEPALTERLLADVEGRPGALPLLQFALTEVWKRRDVRKLTLPVYTDLGNDDKREQRGIEAVLEHRADEIYRNLTPEDQDLCRRLFLRLVQPGEGTEDTKRRVSYRELLLQDPTHAEAVKKLVHTLANRDTRLVTTEGTEAAGGAVEVAHEALIRGWTQLRGWVDAERVGLRTHRRLTEAAQQWADAVPEGKDGFLYTGAWLAMASEWAKGHENDLNVIEKAFLEASQDSVRHKHEKEIEDAKGEAETQRRLSRKFLITAVVAAVCAVVAGVLGLLANAARTSAETASYEKGKALEKAKEAEANEKGQRIRAEGNARIAESRRLAMLSDSVRPHQLDVAMLLALEASVEDTLEARGSLQRCLDDRPEVTRILHIPEGYVSSVAFDPQGRIAAGYINGSVGRDGGVVVFDVRGERLRPTPLEIKEGRVSSVAVDSHGRIAAGYGAFRGDAVGDSGGVVVFDARGERLRPTPLQVKEGDVSSVAVDSHGRIAAGYGRVDGGGVVVFDARGERLRPTPLEVKEGRVSSVAVDPQGRIVAGYGGHVSGVVVFDARGERLRPTPLEVKEGHVSSVAFGPQGRIAAGYGVVGVVGVVGGGGVVVFDARGQRLQPTPLQVKEGHVSSVAFDSHGRIAAGYGGGVVVFDARGERLRPTPLQVKEGNVTSVAFDSHGRIAAGYGVFRGDAVGVGGGVVVFDARGERLQPTPLQVKEGNVSSVAVDSHGRIAAGYGVSRGVIVGVGGGVVVFDAQGERLQPTPLQVKEGDVSSVAFDSHGRIAAGYGRVVGGGVVVFDARGERLQPTPLQVKEGNVTSVAFDPQGRSAAGYTTAAGRSAARAGYGVSRVVGGGVVVFDARGERLRPTPLQVKEGHVSSVAFDSQGRIAAGYGVFRGNALGTLRGSFGGGVVVFDARGERLQPTPLQVKEGNVTSVAFDSQGRIAAGYTGVDGVGGGVVVFDARGDRLQPTPLQVKEGNVSSVAFDSQGRIAAGYRRGPGVGGVVLFDGDPASWWRKVERAANRNFTWQEWTHYFPESPYHRTIRSRSWPADLPQAERTRSEAAEQVPINGKGAS